jgi:hypothetical protein
MKLHRRLKIRHYEERLKEIRNERLSEAKQIERSLIICCTTLPN